MSDFISSIGLPEVIAGIMVLALNAYVLMGGADYGGGVWDLFASGPRREAQRELIASSIAPVWEANHVWLIVVVVMLFTAFPTVFATLSVVLHVPLTILLVGIVLRGSAFVFRSYGTYDRPSRQRWGRAFAMASVVAPVLLGIIIGALASGTVGDASARVGTSPSFSDVFIRPWLTPFSITVGVFALSLFAFIAAVYLTIEARDEPLREDFRGRALGAAVAVFVTAGIALALALTSAPRVAHGIVGALWSIPLHVVTAIAAIIAFVALIRRRYDLARVAAILQVSCILWGWAFSQYPYLVPDRLTIRGAAAPRITLELLLIGLIAGAIILIPSLRYLFRTFAGRAAERQATAHE